jgi:hypothetical protein
LEIQEQEGRKYKEENIREIQGKKVRLGLGYRRAWKASGNTFIGLALI